MLKILLILALSSELLEAKNPEATPPVEVSIETLSTEPPPKAVAESGSSAKVNAIRIVVKNSSSGEVTLIWADFFARVNRGKWVGSWWYHDLGFKEKIQQCFSSDAPHYPPSIPPLGSISCVLVDPWLDEQSNIEYKFVCLIRDSNGTLSLSESPSAAAVPLAVDKSGVELALNGLSSAIKSLFKYSNSPDPSTTLEVGVSVSHKPLGLVEIAKNTSLVREMRDWQSSEKQESDASYFYVYQTEIANNTTEPLRLAQLVFSTLYEGNWLSGAIKSPVISESEIISTGYLHTVDTSGVPSLDKMKDSSIPPGARAIFPYHWHPKVGDLTSGKHLAILINPSGSVFSAEESTANNCLPIALPPSPSPE